MATKIVVAQPAGAAPPVSNSPELSVSEIANALKRTVEDRFGHVRVRGEISNYRGQHSSGHAYFSLKDAGARLDAVIWKTTFAKLKAKPEEGLEVIATGRITTFPGKSSYQIVIESLEPAGAGALMALLEARRQKFLAEGLFDAPKKPLPFLPLVIGVVTSPTGAVIRDILHRVLERFPRHVLVWPVRVQGDTSAAEIAAAVDGFNALAPGGKIARPDVLIVARGGGSLEDLWSFNEEIVVRAVAASAIPVISAVGHETDTTLVDFVSDLRAPTPTGAAERCVPVRVDLLAQIADLARRRHGSMRRRLDQALREFNAHSRALPTRDGLLATPRQQTDRGGERLEAAMARLLNGRRRTLDGAAAKLARHAPQAELARAIGQFNAMAQRLERESAHSRLVGRRRDGLSALDARLRAAFQSRTRGKLDTSRIALTSMEARMRMSLKRTVSARAERVQNIAKLMNSLSYKSVLARGFALAESTDGIPFRTAASIAPGASFNLKFADGAVSARADDADAAGSRDKAPTRPSKPSSQKAGSPKSDQGSLF